MVMPIITSVVREVFSQTPPGREGGRARARGHAVGDDPRRRAALRPGRHHRRHDAGARPGARRDHRRRAAAPAGSRRSPIKILQNGGATVVGVHRQPGRRRRVHGVRPDGGRPRALRDDPGHQHDRVGRGGPQPLRASGSSCDRRPRPRRRRGAYRRHRGRATATSGAPEAPVARAPTAAAVETHHHRGSPRSSAVSASASICLNWLVFDRPDRRRQLVRFRAVRLRRVPGPLRVVTDRSPRPARGHRPGR